MDLSNYTIGILGLSKPVTGEMKSAVEDAITWLRSHRASVIVSDTAYGDEGYRTASIERRVSELESMLKNTEINLILNTNGGYNSNELLEFIDWSNLECSSPWFVGYSDIDAVNLALWTKTKAKVVCGTLLMDGAYDGNALSRLLRTIERGYTDFRVPEMLWDYDQDPWPFQGTRALEGKLRSAEGHTICANLSTFVLMLGTEYLPSLDGCVLFLEYDSEEANALPSLQRMLWQVRQNGVFDHIRGLVFGALQYNVVKEEAEIANLQTILAEVTQGYDFPVLYNSPFGHIFPSWDVPYGQGVLISGTELSARCYHIGAKL